MSLTVMGATLLSGAIMAGAQGVSGLFEMSARKDSEEKQADIDRRVKNLQKSQFDFDKRIGEEKWREGMAYQKASNMQRIEDAEEQGKEARMGMLRESVARGMGERADRLKSAQKQAQRRGGLLG